MIPTVLFTVFATLAAADEPVPDRAAGSVRRFAHTEITTASPAVLWAHWMDVEGWPSWDTELESASVDASLASGVTGSLVSGGRTSAFEVVAFEPDRRYAYAVPLPGGRLVVDRSLEPLPDGGTRFTHAVSLRGFGGWLLGPVLGRRFRRALPGVMRALRDLAERPET